MAASRLFRLNAAILVAVVCIFALLAIAISQETSIGALRGKVIIQENGNPISVPVHLTPLFQTDGGRPRYETTSTRDGSFSFRNLPVGYYKLEITAKAHYISPVDIAISEGKTTNIEVELAPEPPSLDLLVHQHIFTPDERPQITCKGFVPSDDLAVRIYRVDLNSFLVESSGDLQSLLGGRSYYDESGPPVILDGNPALTLAKSLLVPIKTRDLEGVFIQRINLPRLAPGLYVTEVNVGGLQRVDLSGDKADNLQRLGWVMVTSLGLITKSAGSDTLAYTVDLKTGAPVASADVTMYQDSKAVASGKTGADGLLTLRRLATAGGESKSTTVARSGGSFAFVSSWLYSEEQADKLVYAYTDRPVYRPGQKVFFRGIVRQIKQDGYNTPASMPVTVEVRDPDDTLIYRATKRTDKFGAYSGGFPLNPETSSGYYTLVSTPGGHGQGEPVGFQVMSYRKPEFSVKVDFPRKQYVRGETVHAKVSATYYFGAPVANAKVACTIHRSPYWLFDSEMAEEYEEDYEGGYEDYGGYGEMVKEVEARTNSNGEAEITFPADWPQPKGNDAWDSDQQFTVEATVTDVSNREATGNGSVVATRGDFAIEVQSDRYVVEPGASVGVSIRAVDYDKHPMKNQDITVQIGYQNWTDKGESKFDEIREERLTTDSSGVTHMSVKAAKPGELQVIAKSRDRRGNHIVSSAGVWAYSGAYEYEYGSARFPDLQIVTDKKTYDPGDTATVLINTKTPGATALVTIEGSRVYDRMTVRLKGKTTMVRIPVKSEYKPNFYIGVCFVKNKGFTEQQARAKVTLNAQSLNIKVQPDKPKYRPGEKATYKIKVTDGSGKPVVAQLSVGVVDEAIYAIAEDRTDPILDFFYSRRYNQVQTSFSFPEIYLSDPDKAGAPAVSKPVRVRKRFVDTAFWTATVVTDAAGEATVSFTMPDNLTTWRTTVRGITAETSCGQTTGSVLARQDFLVRLEMPRFLVQKDSSTITAVVHNYTGRGQRAEVEIKAPGLRIDGRAKQSVRVRDGGVERLDWRVSAPTPGSFTVTVRATGETAGDAMQLDIPVYPHGVEHVIAETGSLTGTKSAGMNVTIRNDSIPGVTKLKIRLAPSLAATMLGSLDYLAQYPYGCTEQTTSAFIPDVVLSRTLKELGMRNPKLEAKLPDMVAKGLFRLYRFQLDDGGWSWGEYGKSDPWMTAYVCYGLVMARNAGFPVNDGVLGRGFETLAQQVAGKKIDAATRTFGLYVLALAGQDVSSQLTGIADRTDLDSRSLALVALGFSRLGRPEEAKSALHRLFAQSVSEAGMVHWGHGDQYFGGGVETTALGLKAVMTITPKDPRAFKIVRWLMHERRGDCWYSTRDTAMVLYAMAEFLKQTKELSADSNIVVVLNGKTVARTHFGKQSIGDPEFEVTLTSRDLRKGRNSLEIRKTGVGNLYYTTQLTQWVARDHIPATVSGSGVSIRRQYYNPSARYYEKYSDKYLGSQVDRCRPGDVILVRLIVTASAPLDHLLIEDFIPSGCEIIDKGSVNPWEWSYWWIGQDVRDEKTSFYVHELPKGKHVIGYQMRAGFSGDFHALPAQVFAMYDPQVRAASEETEFTIR